MEDVQSDGISWPGRTYPLDETRLSGFRGQGVKRGEGFHDSPELIAPVVRLNTQLPVIVF